jgi:hypothetical protein
LKSKQIGFVLIIALIGASAFVLWYNFGGAGGQLPPPFTPPTTDPTTGEKYSFSMFQALRVVYSDGTDSWKYPSSRTALNDMVIISDKNKLISTMQAYIFFNFMSSKQVSSIAFTANAKLSLYSGSTLWVKDLGDMPVSQTITSPVNNTDNYVISATQTAAQFQALYNYPIGPATSWTYVITCSNIRAVVTYADGTSRTVGLTGVQATQNQLRWGYAVFVTGTEFQITGTGVEWKWT